MSIASPGPPGLLEALSPRVRLDAPVIGDWELCDCYRPGDETLLRLELRRVGHPGAGRILIDVAPSPTAEAAPRPCASARGLGFSYHPCSAPDAAVEACRVLADALGPAPWGEAASSGRTHLEDAVDRVPSALDGDPDRELIDGDSRHHRALYGTSPRPMTVLVSGTPAPGPSMYYPPPAVGLPPSSAAVEPAPPRVARRRAMRRHFGRLGFAFDEVGTLRTVPTPSTFARALAARGESSVVTPRMIRGRGIAVSAIRWASYVRRGILPVSVAPAWAVAWHRLSRRTPLFAHLPCDVGMLAHDMGLHALGLHAMPRAAWDELMALAVERARSASLVGLAGTLGRLSRFFEGPLTARCWEVWAEVGEPEDFPSRFDAHFVQLADMIRRL